MKKVVVLSGAGMSAESGVKTFRDHDGLWENHRVEEVASPEAWHANPEMVMRFYNERRKQLYEVEPNSAHYALVRLEDKYDVAIVTQNVDDLHERAGSSNVLHLHGELKKVRSSANEKLVYQLDGWELKIGDKCELGSQLRPHIVWFGEAVPMIEEAARVTMTADILIIIGTSLNVYPAAGLVQYTKTDCKKYLIDPKAVESPYISNTEVIREKAGKGTSELVEKLINY